MAEPAASILSEADLERLGGPGPKMTWKTKYGMMTGQQDGIQIDFEINGQPAGMLSFNAKKPTWRQQNCRETWAYTKRRTPKRKGRLRKRPFCYGKPGVWDDDRVASFRYATRMQDKCLLTQTGPTIGPPRDNRIEVTR